MFCFTFSEVCVFWNVASLLSGFTSVRALFKVTSIPLDSTTFHKASAYFFTPNNTGKAEWYMILACSRFPFYIKNNSYTLFRHDYYRPKYIHCFPRSWFSYLFQMRFRNVHDFLWCSWTFYWRFWKGEYCIAFIKWFYTLRTFWSIRWMVVRPYRWTI